ncbi:LysR family transcriptional regulator [Ruegeria jejuensis]|uniref:LysR family transcriptional regulator n=1 Tax=Ruegeria jejuensis TaxID=3233338 RepID=UPI00355AF378
MKNLNLNSLRMFASAARHGSFLKAGVETNLSQGAISQRIKQLEIELGVMLFEREPRGVSLTQAGQELFQTVETCLEMLDKTASQVQQLGNEVTVHVSPTIARKWLAPRLPMFSKLKPGLKLTIEASAQVLERPLHQNEIALRHGKTFGTGRGQQMQQLIELELVAVCSSDLSSIGAQPSLEKILASSLIQDSHRRWDKLLARHCSQETLEPLNFNSASLAIDAAINKQGIAIVPLLFVQDDIDAGHLREVWRDEQASGEHIFLVWPTQPVTSKPVMDVVHLIQNEFCQNPNG